MVFGQGETHVETVELILYTAIGIWQIVQKVKEEHERQFAEQALQVLFNGKYPLGQFKIH